MTLAHSCVAFMPQTPQQFGTKISMTEIRFGTTTIYARSICQENTQIVQHCSLFNKLNIDAQFRVSVCHFQC